MNFKDYIRGQRHGKEANRLEREVMNDPFLQDAIDGYDSVGGNPMSAIEKLEKQLAPPPKRIDKRVWMWAAAAVLVLLIGIPFLLRQPDIKDVQVASSEAVKQEETAILSPESDSVLMADNIEPKAPQESAVIPVPAEVREQKLESREAFVAQEVADDAVSKEIVTRQQENAVRTIEPEQVSVAKTIQPKQETIQGRVAGVATASNTKLISGKIVDETGEPLSGVSINIKNTTTGTVTDIDGNFKLTVPKDERRLLVANYIGMRSQEMQLQDNMGDITMKADEMALNEVVVTGYGTQRKRSYTGSVSKTKDSGPTFGETEFKQYFEENYDKTLCKNEPILIKVEFFVNVSGRISNIQIKETSCPTIETEVKRLLLGSPAWSNGSRIVKMHMEL